MLRSIGGKYVLRLTDGYIKTKSYDLAGTVRDLVPAEKLVADELIRLTKRPYLVQRIERSDSHPRLHVWIVGASGWLERAPEIFRILGEKDADDAYRVVICGEDVSGSVRRPGMNWTPWISYAGIRKRKKHTDHRAFKEIGETLLDMMHEHYRSKRQVPTPVLEQFGVPIQFSDYEPSSADSAFS